MSGRPSHIPQKRPIYIGCEGASEVSYASFLQDLIRDARLPVHLVIDELGPGAGDPLSRIEMAVRRVAQLCRTRTTPRERFALLDSDQADRDIARADRARTLADQHDITIVWQRPCLEAVLLRHLDGRSDHRPPDASAAQKALLKDWPAYQKPMSRASLAKKLDSAAVLRAAEVEPELNVLLACVGLK